LEVQVLLDEVGTKEACFQPGLIEGDGETHAGGYSPGVGRDGSAAQFFYEEGEDAVPLGGQST
jgi:hypothetical protein